VNTVIDSLLAIRRLVRAVTDRLQWLPPTLARFTVGWIFLWSGWGKLHSLDRVIEFFGSLGIPHPELQAPFASATEFACGALMLAGLFTRLASVPLVIVMLVAIATAQRENVNGLGDLFGLSEYLYITLLVWIGVAGAGPLSLDHALVRLARRGRRDEVRAMPPVASLAPTAR
jgi:putative oxidoreductase